MRIKAFIIFSILIFTVLNTIAAENENTYTINPGDVLEISVWRDESLTREVVVPPDGVLSFPLVGDIRVDNMTAADLRNRVTEKIVEYVPDATVTVMLMQINGLKAFVIGKVNKPGAFSINMDTDVMQILAMAGGLNPFASESRINILRRKDGNNIKIPFNYNHVLKGKNLEQNIILKRGDVVVVP